MRTALRMFGFLVAVATFSTLMAVVGVVLGFLGLVALLAAL